jgi:lysozyme
MDKEKLKKQLKIDEGIRYSLYRDSLGFLTIGVGHNLDSKSISLAAVEQILQDDIEDTIKSLDQKLPWYPSLSENRQLVLANMCFNLGINKLLEFRNTLKAIQEGRYEDAAEGMKNSRWATQVGNRATRLIQLMREG